ncbi:MAG: hypothetical protein IPP33_16855 [Flavobacteriales bacterium]|nr:hypothetical protein [Flavobacteriales bacterium]
MSVNLEHRSRRNGSTTAIWVCLAAHQHRSTLGKKLTTAFYLCSIITLLGGCRREKGFVKVGSSSFEIDGQLFVPLAVNYILSIRTDRQQPWIGPGVDYADSIWLNQSHERDIGILRGHFEMIKDAGFNTVRLVGFSKLEGTGWSSNDRGRITPFEEKRFRLDSADMRARYLNELEQVINLVHDAGLKAILLADMKPGDPYAEGLFIDIAKRFQDDPTVMASTCSTSRSISTRSGTTNGTSVAWASAGIA